MVSAITAGVTNYISQRAKLFLDRHLGTLFFLTLLFDFFFFFGNPIMGHIGCFSVLDLAHGPSFDPGNPVDAAIRSLVQAPGVSNGFSV